MKVQAAIPFGALIHNAESRRLVNGRHFYLQRIRETNPIAEREDAQDVLL